MPSHPAWALGTTLSRRCLAGVLLPPGAAVTAARFVAPIGPPERSQCDWYRSMDW
jgi:hypothetical protein